MNTDTSFLTYIAHSSFVIQLVIGILVIASLVSWTFIFQRVTYLKRMRSIMVSFEDLFWSGADMNKIYGDIVHRQKVVEGVHSIFIAGFKEYLRARKQSTMRSSEIIESVQRAMHIARSREIESLEERLSYLATVGSTSPYVGLFGTVWGIMTAFHALGNVQQATISMVAPGISEALITTAMGLFAAIPAVISYNHFASQVERLLNQYETFQDEFLSIVERKLHPAAAQTHHESIEA